MWRYHLVILLMTPLMVVYTVIRAIKLRDSRYLLQRFCFGHLQKYFHSLEKPIWFHAASVGEIIAVIPLMQKTVKQHPNIPLLITTNTTTSAEIVTSQFGSNQMVQHIYMPIDWKWAMHKVIKAIQPRCIFVIETELWPNLFNVSHKKNIPVVIINARLSHRTTTAKPWLLQIYKITLKNLTLILARSKQDFTSYLTLGAPESKLKLIGNIKFASNENQNCKSISLERPYVLAASTHEDEETQLASIWIELVNNKIVTNELLVIVPRHPERTTAIAQKIKSLGIDLSIRSKNEHITATTQIYLADTVGELKQFMLDAKFIFMGGSLISHGGQNIIEPAQLAKAIIFGQYMFNFKDETKLLLDNNAAIQINNKNELLEQFTRLLQDSSKITRLSESAFKVMRSQGNSILEHYFAEIEKYIIPGISTLQD